MAKICQKVEMYNVLLKCIATFGQNKPRCLDWLKLKSNFFGSILFFRIFTVFSMVIVLEGMTTFFIVLEGMTTFFPYKFIHFLTLSVTIGEWQVQINDAGMER